MKNFDFRKHLMPHLLALAVFLSITAVYFLPVIEGEQLPTHDIKQYKGMAKEVLDFREETGEVSLWTNSMFGGMPTYQIATPYPNSIFLIKAVYNVLAHGLPKPMNMLFLAFLCFYVMLLAFKVDWRLAIAGALAYGFSTYMIIVIDAGHNTKALAIAFAPLVIAGVQWALNGRKWLLGAAFAGIAMAFELKVNHVQITYYLGFILLAFGISWFIQKIKERDIKMGVLRAAVLAFAFVLGAGANAGNIMTTAEYAKESTRGPSALKTKKKEGKSGGLDFQYATDWSYGVGETFTLLIPNFMGGGSQNTIDYDESEVYNLLKTQYPKNRAESITSGIMYWGPQPGTNGPVYVGALMVFLFVFGLFISDNRTRIWIGVVTLLAIMLSWGRNFEPLSRLFFEYFPMYNKFRTVSMILVVAQITIPLMGILAVSSVVKGKIKKEKILSSLKWSAGIVGGLCLLFFLMPGMFLNFGEAEAIKTYNTIADQLIADRKSLLRSDALRSLFYVLVGAGAILLFALEKIRTMHLALILIIASALDLWLVDSRYLYHDKFERARAVENQVVPSQADKQILQDPDKHFRVLNLGLNSFSDATTSYFHKSLGGYHGAKLQRIQDLITHRITPEIRELQNSQYRKTDGLPVINMFNTKYFIAGTKNGPIPVPNPNNCGDAWIVPQLEVVATADQMIDTLANFDPKKVAYVHKEFSDYLQGFEEGNNQGSVTLTDYKPNQISYQFSSDKEAFVVFSEVYYRGNVDWISTVDGEEKDHIRVNYLLRGMRVPAGEHEIVFTFDPPTYARAETASLVSSLLLILMLAGGIALWFKENRKEEIETEEVSDEA